MFFYTEPQSIKEDYISCTYEAYLFKSGGRFTSVKSTNRNISPCVSVVYAVPVYDYDSGMIVHDSQMIGRRAQLCGDTGQMGH